MTNFGTPTAWQTYSFAAEWFHDALEEARAEKNHHARRREIVFAVCCAESYLIEWVRDDVLNREFNRLNDFFPPGEGCGIKEKWKEIPKALTKAGLIPNSLDTSKIFWRDWTELVDLRNGLVHARASRPETNPQPEKEKPLPSKSILDAYKPGHAVAIVIKLIQELHAAVGTPVPTWLISPQDTIKTS